MKNELGVFEEHGGVLFLEQGRAKITFFGHQIATQKLSDANEVTITPSNVKITVSDNELELVNSLKKEITSTILYSKAKSCLTELAYIDDEPNDIKKDLLTNLRKELNNLIKEL